MTPGNKDTGLSCSTRAICLFALSFSLSCILRNGRRSLSTIGPVVHERSAALLSPLNLSRSERSKNDDSTEVPPLSHRDLLTSDEPNSNSTEAVDVSVQKGLRDSINDRKSRPLNFVHIPKTGGTSVEQAAIHHNLSWGHCLFQSEYPKRGCRPDRRYQQKWPKQKGRVIWHTPIQYLPLNHPNPYNDYDLFAIIRNPYERAISEFYYRCKIQGRNCKGKDGQQGAQLLNNNIQSVLNRLRKGNYYANNGHWIPQYDFFYDEHGNRMVTHLLHNELLKEEFPLLMKAYGLNVSLPEQPMNSRADLGAKLGVVNLTIFTLRLIEAAYEKDFELGGYEMISAGPVK